MAAARFRRGCFDAVCGFANADGIGDDMCEGKAGREKPVDTDFGSDICALQLVLAAPARGCLSLGKHPREDNALRNLEKEISR
ncbi:MAG: hypothetical protein OXC72_10995 [Roseovarius sp.]|nr:hypothetical protein [Roseovarius sp.]MCY4292267.1 hypothetical protein [Roseovarius sp.]